MDAVFQWMEAYPLLVALFIVAARIVDVTIGTMRTIAVVRGYRVLAAVLGFFEVVIWITAVSGVLKSITLLKVIAYGLGFALGNASGVMLERRLAMGQQIIFMVSRHHSHAITGALRLADFTVTELAASGRDGPVAMCMAVVPRRRADTLINIARGVDADVQLVIGDVRATTLNRRPHSLLATGWRAWAKKK